MDVHLLDAEPTAAERDAVDAFLGPPLSSWVGADRVDDGHSGHGGHSARAERHQLLPTLHALQAQAGWISPGGLNYIARRLTIPPRTSTGRYVLCAVLGRAAGAPGVAYLRRRGVPLRRLGSHADRADRPPGRQG